MKKINEYYLAEFVFGEYIIVGYAKEEDCFYMVGNESGYQESDFTWVSMEPIKLFKSEIK